MYPEEEERFRATPRAVSSFAELALRYVKLLARKDKLGLLLVKSERNVLRNKYSSKQVNFGVFSMSTVE